MRRQQIIETVECDHCGEETDAPIVYVIEICRAGQSGGSPIRRTLDLCPQHAQVVAELHEVLRRAGRPVTSRTAAPTLTDCPICSESIRAAGMSVHLIRAHGASARQSPQCPDCDQPLKSQAGAIAHRTNIHGYSHVAELIASVTSPKSKRAR